MDRSELVIELEKNPKLEKKLLRLLEISKLVEGVSADDVEEALIPDVRALGLEFLEMWSESKQEYEKSDLEFSKETYKHGKKNCGGEQASV